LVLLPWASVVEHETAVMPIAKVLPDAGRQLTATAPSIASTADAANVTIAPLGLVAGAVMLPGRVRTGAVVS
jgi:hypothetical protein